MAKYRDIVEHVQVRTPLHVVEVIAPATFDMGWLFIVVLLRAGKTGVATLKQLLCINQRLSVTGEPKHGLRRWA
ncbi:hypothetical protein D3C76_1642470 [compost metagenome]